MPNETNIPYRYFHRTMKQSQFILLPFILLTICFCTACNKIQSIKQDKPDNIAPLTVSVQIIGTETSCNTHTYVGKLESASSIPLSMQTAGQVISVSVKKGDKLTEGQEILRLDNTQARNTLQAAKASLRQIDDGYRRAKKVFAEGGVTEQKMVELRSQRQQAQAMVAMSEKTLNDCVLRAPSNGVLGDFDIHVGQVVAPGIPIATLINNDTYKVTFDVAENDITNVHIGDSARLYITAIGKDTLNALIVEKNLIANNISHTYTIKAMLLNNSLNHELLPGMVSKVWLKSQTAIGYTVPTECVQTLKSGQSVWIAVNGIAQRRKVEIGQYVGNSVLITSGLHEGDIVIIDGFQKLYNGAKLNY